MFWKAKQPLVIQIPNPCSEDWDKMTISDRGHFCASCQRHLVDFSVLTDKEIIKTLKNNTGKICGRFAKNQLNRPLLAPTVAFHIPTPISRVQKIAASLLLFHSFLNQASAQQKPATTTHLSVNNNSTAHKNPSPVDTAVIVIKGKLTDYHSGEALKKIEIEIEGTDIKTLTDKYGKFKFSLPGSFLHSTLTLNSSQANKSFLDTTASIIPSEQIFIDSLRFRKDITMHRYPIDTLPEFVQSTTKGATYREILEPIKIGREEVLGVLPRGTGGPWDDLYQQQRLTRWQKFKAFFKRKKKQGGS